LHVASRWANESSRLLGTTNDRQTANYFNQVDPISRPIEFRLQRQALPAAIFRLAPTPIKSTRFSLMMNRPSLSIGHSADIN
jgi:hypothetical protein